VQPVQYPELLPLCSLDAVCVASLSAASMAHFDGGGLLDTSLDLGPLRELLGHRLVRFITFVLHRCCCWWWWGFLAVHVLLLQKSLHLCLLCAGYTTENGW
jgi:hypothetical protein